MQVTELFDKPLSLVSAPRRIAAPANGRSRERRAQKQDKKLFRHTHGLVRTKIGLFPEPHPASGAERYGIGPKRRGSRRSRARRDPVPRANGCAGAHEEPGGADRAARTPGKDGQ